MPINMRVELIEDFLKWLHEPFENVFPLTAERADYIARQYFGAVKALSDDTVPSILDVLRQSIQREQGHDRIREWKRCCYGIADFLLGPRDLDGADRVVAAGVVVRLSGYVHHRIPFFLAFRPVAVHIAERIWGPGFLQYEKTGGAITVDESCLTPDGYLTLWDFAKGSPNEVLRTETETRALASRILNFICLHDYARIRINRDDFEYLAGRFAHDEHVLFRWSVGDKNVDLLCQRIEVPAHDLLMFLRRSRFDSNKTYKPGRDRREGWFRRRWTVRSGATPASTESGVLAPGLDPERGPGAPATLPQEDPFWQMMQGIWKGQQARGHVPRSEAEIEKERTAIRDDWEQRMQEIQNLKQEARKLREQRL